MDLGWWDNANFPWHDMTTYSRLLGQQIQEYYIILFQMHKMDLIPLSGVA